MPLNRKFYENLAVTIENPKPITYQDSEDLSFGTYPDSQNDIQNDSLNGSFGGSLNSNFDGSFYIASELLVKDTYRSQVFGDFGKFVLDNCIDWTLESTLDIKNLQSGKCYIGNMVKNSPEFKNLASYFCKELQTPSKFVQDLLGRDFKTFQKQITKEQYKVNSACSSLNSPDFEKVMVDLFKNM